MKGHLQGPLTDGGVVVWELSSLLSDKYKAFAMRCLRHARVSAGPEELSGQSRWGLGESSWGSYSILATCEFL